MLAFVYGGSGSGKSAFAENLAFRLGGSGSLYVATMWPDGGEARERIARHRACRAHKGFVSVERYVDLAGLEASAGAAALLECVGNLLANEMFAPGGAGAEKAVDAVWRGIEALRRQAGHVVVVSNDVCSDGAEYAPETLKYCAALAGLNRRLAAASDTAVEMVCGIPLFRKSEGA